MALSPKTYIGDLYSTYEDKKVPAFETIVTELTRWEKTLQEVKVIVDEQDRVLRLPHSTSERFR